MKQLPHRIGSVPNTRADRKEPFPTLLLSLPLTFLLNPLQ
jgi:hypothetical protein